MHNPVENADNFAKRMKEFCKQTMVALGQAARQMKQYYDRRHTPEKTFKVWDCVYLDALDLCTLYLSRKLGDQQLDPFKITKVISLVNYQLQLPRNWKLLTNTFHVSKLKELMEDENLHGPTHDPPLPEIINNQEEYKVERILDSRMSGCQGLQYLVK